MIKGHNNDLADFNGNFNNLARINIFTSTSSILKLILVVETLMKLVCIVYAWKVEYSNKAGEKEKNEEWGIQCDDPLAMHS